MPQEQALPGVEELLEQLAAQMRTAVDQNTALVGIYTGGVWIAQWLHRALDLAAPLGTLDVSFYRDDYEHRGLHRDVKRSDIPFPVEGRHIVLVDDVLYTGRTIRAAMNELFDYGRPASIRLAALLDRGGRELPICPQFVGAVVALGENETIELKRAEDGRLSLTLARV